MDKSKAQLIKECKQRGIKGYSSKTKEQLLAILENPPNPSPLRYPGGKSRAVKILYEILTREYGTKRTTLISPFFGGGSFELAMHSKGYKINANDLFNPLYLFWDCLKKSPHDLVNTIRSIKRPVSKEDFTQLRNRINECTNELEKATIFFVINRCSFSGATFCGGFSKEASEKRFTDSCIERLGSVDLKNVSFSNLDFSEFLERHPEHPDSIMYLDPPYHIDSYIYGKNGDLHEDFNHRKLFDMIKYRKDWILSYNDCEFIRDMYSGFRIQPVNWEWGMSNGKKSSEIIILPIIG